MTRLASQLVGRDAELATLARVLEAVGEGATRFLLVSGEPGIGKTTLLQELGARADALGFLVLQGRGAEFERGLPFSVVVDALDVYLESLDARTLERMAGDGLPEIAPVFPALRELTDAPETPTGQADRFLAHHALRGLIERLAVGRPLLLTLDDMHWADNPSLELVAHLLRRPPARSVLVAVAARTGQLPGLLTAAVEAAARDGHIDELALGPLARDDAETLMEGLEPGARSRIYRESGGNPFYLDQLARARARGGGAAASDGVPGGVAAAIRGELDALSAPARTLIEAASVAGDPFEIDLACEVAGVEPASAMSALDLLVARGLLQTTDVPRRFRFRHPLVRAAVYEGFAPGSRLTAHERAAAALAAQGAPAAARAHHVEASAAPGDLPAADLLEQAGAAVARLDPAAAARWYGAALRLLPADDERRTRVEVALGVALAAAGKPNEAISTLASVLERLPPDPGPDWIEPTILCSTLEHMVGQAERAHGWMLRALDLGGTDPVPRVRVMTHLAMVARYSGDYHEMRRWAEEAAAVADAGAERLVAARALALRAYAASHAGDIDRAVADREHAAEVLRGLRDEQLADDLDVLIMLASASYFLDRPADARAESERVLTAAHALGRGQWWPVATLVAATAELALGRLERSAQMNDDVIDRARLAGDPQSLMWALSWRARAAALRGDLATALSAGEECLELLSQVRTVGLFTWFAGNHAATLLAAGQPARARDTILTHGGPELSEVPAIDRSRQCALIVEAALALGSLEEADEWCDRAGQLADSLTLPISSAHACRARALLLAARGEHDAAAATAAGGIDAAEAAGAAIEAAQLRLAAGRGLAATGDTVAATALLERAEDVFASCGAGRLRQEATSELRRLGRGRHARARPGRPAVEGLRGLSEREREIALLVRRRRTNPEIADELFLSPKTVETHLRNIFRKLDVSSRVQVAEIVEREERSSG